MRIDALGVGRWHGHRAAAFLPVTIALAGHEVSPCSGAAIRETGASLPEAAVSVRYRRPEEGSCPSCCSMPPAAVARPPRCRTSMLAGRRATRGFATPADPPTVDEIVALMPAAGDGVHGRRLRGLIVVLLRAACASTRRSRSPRPTWTHAAGHCSCGAARAGRVASSRVNARSLLLALLILHGARACTRRSPSPSAASGRDPLRPGPVRSRSRCGTSAGG
jgi:hypothetical protein